MRRRVEQPVAHVRFERPEALDLRLREMQARHFEVLRSNDPKPSQAPSCTVLHMATGPNGWGFRTAQLSDLLGHQCEGDF